MNSLMKNVLKAFESALVQRKNDREFAKFMIMIRAISMHLKKKNVEKK
jgi:hypothetical protein